MALETGTYISDLVSTNPASSDNISQGDDHIRLLKSTIKATFPNITGAVTLTHTQLNDAARKAASNTFTANQVISVTDNTNAALRITQLGTGDAIRVEDSTNPDSTPFVVDASGSVGIGIATPGTKLDITGTGRASVSFEANDGTTVNRMSVGSGVAYLGTTSNHPVTVSTNNTERMRIESGGTISVAGATMPWAGGGNVVMPDSSALSFSGTTGHFATNLYYNTTWRNGSNAAGGLYVQGAGAHVWYNVPAAATGTAAALQERMRIRDDGSVLIGRGNVSYGASSGVWIDPAGAAVIERDSNSCIFLRRFGASSNGAVINFGWGASNTAVGSVSVTSSATSYNTSSDYRLKEDIQPVSNAAQRLMSLKPVNFAWKIDGSRVDGFIAHEAQEVVPEAVTGAKDAVDADGNPIYQGIDQSKLVPLLTAALQEALTEISSLKARVAALEAA